MTNPGQIQNDVVPLEGSIPLPITIQAALKNSPKDIEVAESLERVKQITSQIFHGEAKVVQREDNEIPGDLHYTFCVADTGDTTEILARYNRWHSRLNEMPVDVRRLFRLSIDAR